MFRKTIDFNKFHLPHIYDVDFEPRTFLKWHDLYSYMTVRSVSFRTVSNIWKLWLEMHNNLKNRIRALVLLLTELDFAMFQMVSGGSGISLVSMSLFEHIWHMCCRHSISRSFIHNEKSAQYCTERAHNSQIPTRKVQIHLINFKTLYMHAATAFAEMLYSVYN